MTIYKMGYIPAKTFCLSLREIPDANGYYCLKTKERCVGAVKNFFGILNDKIDSKLVEECLLRGKTFDDKIREGRGE